MFLEGLEPTIFEEKRGIRNIINAYEVVCV
jgi:hypothetical protein